MSSFTRNRSDGLLERNHTQETVDSFVRTFIIYGVEGFLMTLTNSLIVYTILFYKSLREQKEFIMVGGLAVADGLNGLGFLIASIGRITILLRGDGFVLKSRWECATTPWSIVITFSNSIAGLMLFVLSVDRLLAVTIPFRYFNFTRRYAVYLVGAAFAYVLPPGLVSFYLSYQYQKPEFSAICFSGMGMHPVYYNYFVMFHLVTSFASVILYVPVLIALRRTMRMNAMTYSNGVSLVRLKKVTVTLGIHTFFTLLFNMIPDTLILLNAVKDQTPLYLMFNLNAMVNIIVYTARFKELRNGLKAVIKCKTNVLSFPSWPKTGTTERRFKLPSIIVKYFHKE